jgi:hypothetical protein
MPDVEKKESGNGEGNEGEPPGDKVEEGDEKDKTNFNDGKEKGDDEVNQTFVLEEANPEKVVVEKDLILIGVFLFEIGGDGGFVGFNLSGHVIIVATNEMVWLWGTGAVGQNWNFFTS